MSLTTRVGLLAGAAALTLTGVSSARPAVEGTNNDVAARLAAAEAKIAAMENASNQNWLTEQRANEIKGLVQDVLADADTRASLLQSGTTAGYDKGMVLGSSDGNWLLKTNLYIQERFNWNHLDNGDVNGYDQNRYGFENTRTKFIMSGHVVDPSWYYLVDINVGNNGGTSTGDSGTSSSRTGTGDAYVGKDFGNGWKVQMGAMKSPYLREELVDAMNQLTVERSNTNYFFTQGYADGIQGSYSADQWRAMAMWSDGANTGETDWSNYDTEFAITGRFEYMFSGTWAQFDQFTAPKGGQTGILLGVAANYANSEFGTTASEAQQWGLTADITVQMDGFNFYGAMMGSQTQIDGVSGEPKPWGAVVQAGYYLDETWEAYVRWEWIHFDNSVGNQSILTLGVNKYFAGQNAKWTTDIGFGLNSVQYAADITAWRQDVDNQDGQVVIRTQWQLAF